MNADTQRPLVLVIDDNEMNLKLMQGMMAYAKYDLEIARSAEEGLQKATRIKADIVLMDLQLPEMDGFEATRRLRENDDYRDVPILAVSGYQMARNEARLKASGFNGYIQKPMKLQEVLAALAQYLDGDSRANT